MADFQGHGLFRFPNTGGLQELISVDPSQFVVTPDDEVVADFQGYGLYRYSDAQGWQQLVSVDPAVFVATTNGTVVADFNGFGLYRISGADGLQHLTQTDTSSVRRDTRWNGSGRHPRVRAIRATPTRRSLQQLNANDPDGFDGRGQRRTDHVADFHGPRGCFLYSDAQGWQQLSPNEPDQVAITPDGTVVADFGTNEATLSQQGLYRFSSAVGRAATGPTRTRPVCRDTQWHDRG